MLRAILFGAACLMVVCPLAAADEAVPADRAVFVVQLPQDATLTIEGESTKGTGTERRFSASGLKPGKRYSYAFVATWTEDGKEWQVEKTVSFVAGKRYEVSFTPNQAAKPKDRAAKGDGNTFTSREGRFSVWMPGKAKEGTENLGRGMKRHFVSHSALIRNFSVSYIDFDKETVEGRKPLTLLKVFRSGSRKGKTFEGEKELSHGERKIAGLEYRLDAGDDVFVRERLYFDGNRLYVVLLSSLKNKEYLSSREADRFFDSFKITR